MGDTKVAECTNIIGSSLAVDAIVSKSGVPKSEILQLNGSTVQAPQPACENPALVLEQLLPIDMSSSTLLIGETPPSKDIPEGKPENVNVRVIDSLLDGLGAPVTGSLHLDQPVAPTQELDTPLVTIEQSENVNPSHDAAIDPVLSIPTIDSEIYQPALPDQELDLLHLGASPFPSTATSANCHHVTVTQLQEPAMPELMQDIPHNGVPGTADSYDKGHVPAPQELIMPSTDVSVAANAGALSSQGPDPTILPKTASLDSPKYIRDSDGNRVLVDTAAPIESVRDAVSKFGGIVDWKAHKTKTVERHRFIEQELKKTQDDIPVYRKKSQAAEEAKVKVLKELDTAKRLIEEMKFNVEKAQTEEHQAKQDTELAKLRVDEMEQGIAQESSIAAKAQLEVATARHAAAVSDLQSVKEELEALKRDYAALVAERDLALKKAEEAVAASKEVEKTVQDLTIELIATKEALESAHAVHLETEERRLMAAMAKEQNSQNWEKELKEVEEEVSMLSEQVSSAKDLQAKLDAASALRHDLRAELANYMESKMCNSADDKALDGEQKKTLRRIHTGIQASVASAQNELKDVRLNIEKAIEEVNLLKLAASSLQSELESEKARVATFKQREGSIAMAVKSLEAEINKIELELAEAKVRETVAREQIIDLPMQLPQAAQEVDQLKSLAQQVQNELAKAKEEAERAKAGAMTMESRLLAAEKEIDAAKAAERLALAAIKALQESENARGSDNVSSPNGVTISLKEYYELSKRAHEAEELTNSRVSAVMAQLESAKDSQLRSMEKLEDVDQEVAQRKEILKAAVDKASETAEGKLNLEQELRNWRAVNEQRRKASESLGYSEANLFKSARSSFRREVEKSPTSNPEVRNESSNYTHIPIAHYTSPPSASTATETDTSSHDGGKPGKKKKRSFFPRVLMFLARQKTHSHK